MIQLTDVEKGTPAARIVRWASELKNGYIHKIDNQTPTSIKHMKQIIKEARESNKQVIKITISTSPSTSLRVTISLTQLEIESFTQRLTR